MDYASLVADLQDHQEDDSSEFVAEIPNLISLAEDRIFLAVPQLRSFRTKETGSLVASTKTITPSTTDLRTIRSLHITVSSVLTLVEKRSDTFIDDYTPNPATTGVPKYYSEDDDNLLSFAPTPNDTYAYTLRLTVMPSRLASGNTATYLTDTYPNLMLKAALLESSLYLLYEPDRISVRQADFEAIAMAVAAEIDHSMREESTQGA